MRRVYEVRYAARCLSGPPRGTLRLLGLALVLQTSGCDLNRASVGATDEAAHAVDAALVHDQDAAVTASTKTEPAVPTMAGMPSSPATPSAATTPTSPAGPTHPTAPTMPSSPATPSTSLGSVDASVDGSSVNDAALDDAATSVSDDSGMACDLSGSFALRMDAVANWEGTMLFNIVPIITPGSGTLSVVLLADLKADHTVTFRACGANVPDFASSVQETYGVAFPDEVWEKLALRWSVGFATTCLSTGCALTSDPVIAQLGIGIPEQAQWPTSRDKLDVATVRDDDGDGIPGVLLRCRGPKDPGPKKYSHPPTSYLLTQRVSEIMIAIRIAAQLQGKLENCDRFDGRIENMSVDTRALACQLDTGVRCSPEQLGFVDDDLPVWKIDDATFEAVRVPSGASCADVRNVMLP